MIHGKGGAKNNRLHSSLADCPFYNCTPILCSSSSAPLHKAEFYTEMDNYPIDYHRFTYVYFSQAALGASRSQREQTELSDTSSTIKNACFVKSSLWSNYGAGWFKLILNAVQLLKMKNKQQSTDSAQIQSGSWVKIRDSFPQPAFLSSAPTAQSLFMGEGRFHELPLHFCQVKKILVILNYIKASAYGQSGWNKPRVWLTLCQISLSQRLLKSILSW